MDTHIASAAELDHGAGLSARLPGEPDPEAFIAANPSGVAEPLAHASATPHVRRHPGLLAGAALGVVVLASSAFVVSPYNHVVAVPARVRATVRQLAAEAGLGPDRPFAPAASLASIHLPAQPSAVVTPRYEPKKPDQDLQEILAMHAESHPPASPPPPSRPAPPQTLAAAQPRPAAAPSVAEAGPAPGFVPHEPGSSIAASVAGNAETANAPPARPSVQPTHPSTTDITQAVVAAATVHEPPAGPAPGQAATQATTRAAAATTATVSAPAAPPAATSSAAPAAPVSASTPDAAVKPLQAAAQVGPADATERAQHLQAGPMTDAQQVQVLELITQIATMVHELKQQDASLRADLAKTQEDESARLKDFERRIALAEARNAIGIAEDNPSQAASVPPAPAATPAVRPVSVTRASAALPVDVPAAAKRYRVQAASPGMAMLTEVERGGGDGAQLQVTVGDTIPGWGKVKSVAQSGTSWVVSTEHGVIQ